MSFAYFNFAMLVGKTGTIYYRDRSVAQRVNVANGKIRAYSSILGSHSPQLYVTISKDNITTIIPARSITKITIVSELLDAI